VGLALLAILLLPSIVGKEMGNENKLDLLTFALELIAPGDHQQRLLRHLLAQARSGSKVRQLAVPGHVGERSGGRRCCLDLADAEGYTPRNTPDFL